MKFLVTIAILTLVAVAFTFAGTSDSEPISADDIAVYSAVVRSVIEHRLGYNPDAVFFISMSPASSVQPERKKYVIRDAPPEILDRLVDEGLPVFPGSAAEQTKPMGEVTHRATGQSGLRVVISQVDWEGESDATVYCETYAHGKDGEGRIYHLALKQGAWSVESSVSRRKL